MSAPQQLIGGLKVLAIVGLALTAAAYGRSLSIRDHETALASRCDTFQPFALGGHAVICLTKDGVVELLGRYEAKKQSNKEQHL